MSDSTVGLADLNFPGHSFCTLLLTRAGICSVYCFAKTSYKKAFVVRCAVIELTYVFLEQIEGVGLYATVKFWMFLTSKKGVDLYADRLMRGLLALTTPSDSCF